MKNEFSIKKKGGSLYASISDSAVSYTWLLCSWRTKIEGKKSRDTLLSKQKVILLIFMIAYLDKDGHWVVVVTTGHQPYCAGATQHCQALDIKGSVTPAALCLSHKALSGLCIKGSVTRQPNCAWATKHRQALDKEGGLKGQSHQAHCARARLHWLILGKEGG